MTINIKLTVDGKTIRFPVEVPGSLDAASTVAIVSARTEYHVLLERLNTVLMEMQRECCISTQEEAAALAPFIRKLKAIRPVIAPFGEVATPTHPAEEIQAWACGHKANPMLDSMWLQFELLFGMYEGFMPNRRDSRAQDLFSWLYRGAHTAPVRQPLPGKPKWRCRACGVEVDMVAMRCNCKTSPSPWELVSEGAPGE